MPDIIHMLTIKAPVEEVFEQISQWYGLNRWWTKDCSGRPELGSLYELGFGAVNWQAQITDFLLNRELEYTLCKSDSDWLDTSVRFELTGQDQRTQLKFAHLGWTGMEALMAKHPV